MAVILMCGPAGSSKSTAAKRLEDDGYTRLSYDEEAWARGHREFPLPGDVAAEIDGIVRGRLLELVSSGADVVLDSSFWSRRKRDDYRALLRPLGVTPTVMYLATPREVVLRRVRERLGDSPHSVRLSQDLAAHYFDHFEVPTPDEGPLEVVDISA